MDEQSAGDLLSVPGRGLQVQKWVTRYQVHTASVFILSYCWPLICMYIEYSLLPQLQTTTLWLIIGNWSASKPNWATICTVTSSGCVRWPLAYGADRSHRCRLAPVSLILEVPRSNSTRNRDVFSEAVCGSIQPLHIAVLIEFVPLYFGKLAVICVLPSNTTNFLNQTIHAMCFVSAFFDHLQALKYKIKTQVGAS